MSIAFFSVSHERPLPAGDARGQPLAVPPMRACSDGSCETGLASPGQSDWCGSLRMLDWSRLVGAPVSVLCLAAPGAPRPEELPPWRTSGASCTSRAFNHGLRSRQGPNEILRHQSVAQVSNVPTIGRQQHGSPRSAVPSSIVDAAHGRPAPPPWRDGGHGHRRAASATRAERPGACGPGGLALGGRGE